MHIYLSARYRRRDELRRARDDLVAAGHTVVSRWIDSEDPDDIDDPELLHEIACQNLEDLGHANAFIAFTEPPEEDVPGATRGGRHVEFGYILNEMRDVQVYVVGPRENAFFFLDDVLFAYPDWPSARKDLAQTPAEEGVPV